MASKPKWDKIRAAFCAGRPVHELAAEFGVSIADILRRVKTEKWRRGDPADEPAKNSTKPNFAKLPVRSHAPGPSAEVRERAKVEEAAQDVIRQHRDKTRQHRDTYDALCAEFQGMTQFMLSFVDPVQIEELRKAKPDEAVKMLGSLLKAMAVKFTMFERLTGMLDVIIAMERRAWNLDEMENTGAVAQWEMLLQVVREPSKLRPLPHNVVEFDRKQQERAE